MGLVAGKLHGHIQGKGWRAKQIRVITDVVFDSIKTDHKDHLTFQDLYIAVLHVYNEINKKFPGTHNDPPSETKLRAMMQFHDVNLDGLLDREEFAKFIVTLTADTLSHVGRNLVVAFMVAPCIALIVKKATERIPRIGKIVNKIPNIYASAATVAIVLLQTANANGKQKK